MKVYQEITGYEKSILNLNFLIDNTYSGFSLACGTGVVTDTTTGLDNTGFSFTGYEGYIFDQSGRFVGGYEPETSFTISVHSKEDDTFSYFINNSLIANNYFCPTGFDYIEFEKHGDSALSVEHIF